MITNCFNGRGVRGDRDNFLIKVICFDGFPYQYSFLNFIILKKRISLQKIVTINLNCKYKQSDEKEEATFIKNYLVRGCSYIISYRLGVGAWGSGRTECYGLV